MTNGQTNLQVLLVEDAPDDLGQYLRDFPEVFDEIGIGVDIHPCGDFGTAKQIAQDRSRRFDLVISDTYRGRAADGDAAVLSMIDLYRGHRFCPLIVYSSGSRPVGFQDGAFVRWADKAVVNDIENAIRAVLKTHVPQIARRLHDEIDGIAGDYLWAFLEKEWSQLKNSSLADANLLERVIRRRAATLVAEIDEQNAGIQECVAPEYYVYPALKQDYFSLGDIVRNRENADDIRVILTPHCHLFKQPNASAPRAEFVLLVKAIPATTVAQHEIAKAKTASENTQHKRLGDWARSPARINGLTPDGRYWLLPHFLEIPNCFCDFLQIESVGYHSLQRDFDRLATLANPFAEAFQACFTQFYASIGLPILKPVSISSLLS